MDNDIEDNEIEDLAPAFILEVYDDGKSDDIDILINIPTPPRPDRYASIGLLYALAIMVLERQGTIQEIIDQLIGENMMSEVDCANRITELMTREEDDLPS